MLRKQSQNGDVVQSLLNAQGKVDYRKEVANRQPEMKQAKKNEKDRSWAKEKGYDSSEFNNPVARNGSSVRPARCAEDGGITDMGGPTKHVGMTGKNSIWDSEVLKRLSSTPSSKERMSEEKLSSERLKQLKQSEYKQSMAPKMGEPEDLGKKSFAAEKSGNSVSSKGWVPANKLSIFDTNTNFDRLTALSERVNPKVEKEAEKKESKTVSKAFSSQDATNRFVDGILNQDKTSNYKSVHNSSVDRLFKILSERNTSKE